MKALMETVLEQIALLRSKNVGLKETINQKVVMVEKKVETGESCGENLSLSIGRPGFDSQSGRMF